VISLSSGIGAPNEGSENSDKEGRRFSLWSKIEESEKKMQEGTERDKNRSDQFTGFFSFLLKGSCVEALHSSGFPLQDACNLCGVKVDQKLPHKP